MALPTKAKEISIRNINTEFPSGNSAENLCITPQDILGCNFNVRSTNFNLPNHDVIQNVHKLSCVTQATYNTQGILIDTGASAHILKDKSHFKSFDTNFVPSENYLEMADGSRRNDLIKGKGDAIIPLYDKSGTLRNFVLKNALFVPSFNKNIMSLYNAVRDGVQFNLNSPGEEYMVTKYGIVFNINTKGHLYLINSVISKSQVSRSSHDWHRKIPSQVTRDLPSDRTNNKYDLELNTHLGTRIPIESVLSDQQSDSIFKDSNR